MSTCAACISFQLFYNIFGVNEFKIGGPVGLNNLGISWLRTLENPVHVHVENLTHMYMPWEIEQIACINAFAKDKSDQIFNQVGIDDGISGCSLARILGTKARNGIRHQAGNYYT